MGEKIYKGNKKERNLQAVKKYQQSKKWKEWHDNYVKQKKTKEILYKATQKWRQNNKDKVREYDARKNSKRKGYKHIEIFNNPFPDDIEIDWHHINNLFVVPIPKQFHLKSNCWNKRAHREKCNKWLNKLFQINNILKEN